MKTFFALILVTCSHTQCDTVKPVTEDLYPTRQECEAVSKYFTNVPLRNFELQCAEVKRK